MSDKTLGAENKGTSLSRTVLDFVVMVVVALVLAWAIKTYVVQPYEIPSGSMEPTIEIGNRVLSEKVSYLFGDVEAGDIVTFDDPTGINDTLIKRCIAVSGQTIDLRDGKVYVDGVELDEPYVHGQSTTAFDETMYGVSISYPYTIPDGMIWVMGDNRGNSGDSRYFGPISLDTVTGHAIYTYWPISQIGTLE